MVRKESKWKKCLKAPIRVIIQAKDLYMESWTGPAANVGYGNSLGCPTPHIPTLSRTHSKKGITSPMERDLKELMRVASNKEMELRRSKSTPNGKGLVPPVTRSNTVAFGRIDEDSPFDFGNENVGLLKSEVVPRSRSYAQSMIRKI